VPAPEPRTDVVEPFNADVAMTGGYRYTTGAPLSSCLANRRMTDAVLGLVPLAGRTVIDIGCGDGAHSAELADRGRPSRMTGVDPAAEAIAVARERHGRENVSFDVGDACALDVPDGAFDVAQLRGVLHHLDRPRQALSEALRVADQVVVVEPNGYNPGVKLLERASRYHREHGERSYASRTLNRWVRELGGEVVAGRFVGFVAMFSPDPVARAMKAAEGALERTPGVRAVGCGQYVFVASRRAGA